MRTIVNLFKSLINKREEKNFFSDGSLVKYENGNLKIIPNPHTKVELHGKIHLYSQEEIIIESKDKLKLRGEQIHFNDDKPYYLEDNILENHPNVSILREPIVLKEITPKNSMEEK